ncbi:hypothetical protein [Sulfitobacter sp. PS-8MA]|uniref:hypothetical protein n=1 Tax=Sulfitobacter sp. PS-8MA TaxID=3237707 RepID=UPI0034C6B093
MPRRIILHPGFHKTGSSSIQATLRANRAALKPHVALRLRWHMKDLLHATRGYSTWRDPISLLKAEHRFEALLDSLPQMPRRTLLLSAEELAGHLPGRGDLADYSAAPEALELFHRTLRRRFPKAEIMVYLSTRAADDWLASAYWEHVRSSSMTLSLAAFTARHAPAAKLDEMRDEITRRLPCPVHHAALEDCQHLPLGPATPLLELCDLPPDLMARLTLPPPANTRLPAPVLQALLDANRQHADDPQARRRAKTAILEQADKA